MTLHDSLAAQPLLKGLPDELVAAVEACARFESFAEGATMLRHDVEIRDFYLLLSGRVLLQIDSPQSAPVAVQTLNAGDALGWSWLIPPYRSFFDARALEAVDVIAIDTARMRQAMDDNHDLGYAVLRRVLGPMLNRLQACRLQLMDVYGPPGAGNA